MKQIKFRGKSIYSGKYVCGDLYHFNNSVFIDDETVYENSVAQFIGYDTNGKEIYSDDTVVDSKGNERLVADILINFNSIGGHFDNVILKEN